MCRSSGRLLIAVESSVVLNQLKRLARENDHVFRDVSRTGAAIRRSVRKWVDAPKDQVRYWLDFASRKRELQRSRGFPSRGFSGDDTALFLTWVDNRSFGRSGEYTDPQFGPLPDHMRRRGYRVAYLARVLNTIPFGEAVTRLRKTAETIFSELMLSPGDVFSAIVKTFGYMPRLPSVLLLEGVNIHKLVREQVLWDRMRAAMALVYFPLIRNLARSGVRPKLIFYTFEGHSWDKIMCLAVRKYLPQTKLIAFENLIFSKMMLGAYPSRQEMGQHPMPDRVVTNGPLLEDVLGKEGYPDSLVASGAALRHLYFGGRIPLKQRLRQEGSARVLVATSIGFSDSVELVEKALVAFQGRSNYHLIVKCHPLVSQERVKDVLGDLTKGVNVKFVNAPVEDLLKRVDVLLYTSTSVCYEALLHGVPPIFVRTEHGLNIDQLEPAPQCRWTATHPEDIVQTVDSVLGMSDSLWQKWYSDAQKVVERALAPVTTEGLDRFFTGLV